MHTRRPAPNDNLSRTTRACALVAVCAVVFLPYAFTPANHTAAVAQPKGGRVTPTPTPRATQRKTPRPVYRATPRATPHASPSPTPRPTLSRAPRATPRRATTAPAQPRQVAPQIEMVFISGGTFLMGSPTSEEERGNDEGPQHHVTVPSFYMGKYEVTQAQWRAVMGNNPSSFKGDHRPVENVTWGDAVKFCRRLSQMSGREYRLPSEAEWEYACRAGTTTPFSFGSSLSSEQANFNGNYPYGGAPKGVDRQQTTRVGSFQPNAFGLYDMHGNVMEWCEDAWHDNYIGAPTDGSAWLGGGDSNRRVLRGGSWARLVTLVRSADRFWGYSAGDGSSSDWGLRVVAVAR